MKNQDGPKENKRDIHWARRSAIACFIGLAFFLVLYYTLGRGGDGYPPQDDHLQVKVPRVELEENGCLYMRRAVKVIGGLEETAVEKKMRDDWGFEFNQFLDDVHYDEEKAALVVKHYRNMSRRWLREMTFVEKHLAQARECDQWETYLPYEMRGKIERVPLNLATRIVILHQVSVALDHFRKKEYTPAFEIIENLTKVGRGLVRSYQGMSNWLEGMQWSNAALVLLHKFLQHREFFEGVEDRLARSPNFALAKVEPHLHKSLEEGWKIDYEYRVHSIDDFVERGQMGMSPSLSPLYRLLMMQPNNIKREVLQRMESLLKGVGKPYDKARAEAYRVWKTPKKGWSRLVNSGGKMILSRMYLSVHLNYLKNYHKGLVLYRCLVIRRALWKYRRDHGKWPGKLSHLAPKYLDEIPVDPAHGESFGYDPEKRELWSQLRDKWTGPHELRGLVFPLAFKEKSKVQIKKENKK